MQRDLKNIPWDRDDLQWNRDRVNLYEQVVTPTNDNALVCVSKLRSIVLNELRGTKIDSKMVAFEFYNCFNYSLLPQESKEFGVTVGVTSANPGEGKTLVASNLAVSLAMGYRKKTVLVDLNLQRPCLHTVFDTALSPGLVDALDPSTDGAIHVAATQIDDLFVLSAGMFRDSLFGATPLVPLGGKPAQAVQQGPVFGLGHFSSFLDILHALEQAFEFIIVDMPSINLRDFPVLFASRLSGLMVVVDTTKTKQRDLDTMFRQLNECQVLGFVMNRVKDMP